MRIFALATITLVLATSGNVLARESGLTSSAASVTFPAVVDNVGPKVSYDSGYKRLHDVASELTSVSGITVVAGKDSDDWRVRDIPLVVCVKDLPLDKLVQAVADATHCRCVPESFGDGKTGYRIYRGPSEQAKIDSYAKQARDAALAETKWAWDMLAALGKAEAPSGITPWLWQVSRLIATLDADSKRRVFSGEAILIRGSDPVRQGLVAELYRYAWSDAPKYVHRTNQPTENEINSATLAIELQDTGFYRTLALHVTIDPVMRDGNAGAWTNVVNPYTLRKYYTPSLPKPPEEAIGKMPADRVERPGMLALRKTSDWSLPLLTAKFDNELPSDKKRPAFADLVRGVALASGCNIVAEDFMSNLEPSYAPVHPAFRKNTCVAESLRTLISLVNERGYTWFVNEGDKLLVGWADDAFSTHWQECHAGLLPESYLTGLLEKYNSVGLSLDDFMQFTCLTQNPSNGSFRSTDSYVMWVNRSASFWRLYDPCITGSGFWRIYNSLSPADKALAKSKDGCPLDKLSRTWVLGTLRGCRLGQTNDSLRFAWTPEETRLMMTALTDPDVISTMVMCVTHRPADRLNHHLEPSDYDVNLFQEEAAQSLGLNDYSMVIHYKVGAKAYSAPTRILWLAFPARSFARERELLQSAAKPASR